jgi:hypothetical protein
MGCLGGTASGQGPEKEILDWRQDMARRRTWLGALAAVLLAFVLGVTLAGCGGGGGADPKETFKGTWDLKSVDAEDESSSMSEDDVKLLDDLGMSTFVNLNEDGSAEFVLFGFTVKGEWEAKSATSVSIDLEMDGESSTFEGTLSGDTLTIDVDGDKMSYVKGEHKDAPDVSADSLTEAVEEESTVEDEYGSYTFVEGYEEKTLVDDDLMTIVSKAKGSDLFDDPGFLLSYTNKGSVPVYFTGTGTFTVNGNEASVYYMVPQTIQPGETVEDFLSFDSGEVGTVDDVSEAQVSIEVMDDSTLDTLATYTFTIS